MGGRSQKRCDAMAAEKTSGAHIWTSFSVLGVWDLHRICIDFVGFAFLGVSKTYGNIKKATGFIPPHLPLV